ncbi:hypothetical protein EYF80_011451 [Liparis tanakae]|uniref:Uncharacterized protein n=1 Tax=Liparis tanakae TaxID=230148 RepID=A0A4Z2IKC1_9TELE|nr:hypothetical protein EYF80_011451 [Liparis tanakae]
MMTTHHHQAPRGLGFSCSPGRTHRHRRAQQRSRGGAWGAAGSRCGDTEEEEGEEEEEEEEEEMLFGDFCPEMTTGRDFLQAVCCRLIVSADVILAV